MTRFDIDYIKGDTWNSLIYFKDSAGSPVNISGDYVYFTVKSCSEQDSDDNAVYKQNVTGHISNLSGISQINIPSGSGILLEAGSYFYDAVWKRTDGTIKTFLIGKFNVINGVTLRELE